MASSGEREVIIHDVTLREGQQAPSVALTLEAKIEIARLLHGVGIQWVQAGFAGADDETIRAIKDAVPGLRLSVIVVAFQPDWRNRIQSALDAGCDWLMLLVRAGRRQLAAIGMSEDEVVDRVRESLSEALKKTSNASVEPSFGTVADEALLRRIYRAAAEEGARSVSVIDTTGVATPEVIGHLVGAAREETADGLIGVHCHNDFGLALANTLAGIRAGAGIADASVLGLGERAGNCALEELVTGLEELFEIHTGIDRRQLMSLAECVAARSGSVISESKPIVGRSAFAQQLDMHVRLTDVDPSLLEPYPPETVGNRRWLALGAGTGPVAVMAKARELGLAPPASTALEELTEWVNCEATRRGGLVSEADFTERVLGIKKQRREISGGY